MDLKLARKIAQLSQQDLARKAGVSAAMISRIEGGSRRRPSYVSMVRIARVLHVDPTDLFPVEDVVDDARGA